MNIIKKVTVTIGNNNSKIYIPCRSCGNLYETPDEMEILHRQLKDKKGDASLCYDCDLTRPRVGWSCLKGN